MLQLPLWKVFLSFQRRRRLLTLDDVKWRHQLRHIFSFKLNGEADKMSKWKYFSYFPIR